MKPTEDVARDQPIQDFSDCHVGIVNILDELTALAQQRSPVAQRREVAGRILKFFRDVVTAHHSEEEVELFSAVLADATAGAERKTVEDIVHQLVGEHRRIEGLYAGIAPVLGPMESGGDVLLNAAEVAALVDAYIAHARYEEEVFLPLAQRILGRNSDHMAALGLALHIRHASEGVRRRFGFI